MNRAIKREIVLALVCGTMIEIVAWYARWNFLTFPFSWLERIWVLLTGQVWSGAEFRLKMPLPTVGEAVFRYLWVKFGHGERHFDESWEFYVAAACGLAVQILLFAAAVFAVMRIWRVVRPARVAGHRSEQA